MAFNFLGTFTEAQFEDLEAFVKAQALMFPERLDYLSSQIRRLGWLTYTRNSEGVPTAYQIEPRGCELERRVAAYERFGGDVLALGIRSRGEWISYNQIPPELDSSKVNSGGLTSGDPIPDDLHADDTVPAVTMSKIKEPVLRAIQSYRENSEYDLMKTLDLSEQFLQEMILLAQRQEGVDNLDELFVKIRYYLNNQEFHSAGRKDRL